MGGYWIYMHFLDQNILFSCLVDPTWKIFKFYFHFKTKDLYFSVGGGQNNEQINQLMENQTHILNAIKYLDERMTKVDEKELEKHRGEIKDILQSQAMLDEIIVKSSDDILLMKKAKEENVVAIQMLDAKLDKINEVLKMTKKEIKDKEEKKNNFPQVLRFRNS